MKLKKIASLALAGVMAVSMLTACDTASNGNTNDNDDVIVTPVPTSIVTAVNDGQSATNDVKINFTSDATLDAALANAVKSRGDIGTQFEIEMVISGLTGVKVGIDEVQGEPGWTWDDDIYGLGGHWDFDANVDGKSITALAVMRLDGVLSEDAALKNAAKRIDKEVAELTATTYDRVSADAKYADYAYTGTVSMVSAETVAGTTNYFVAYTITQTTSVKTLAPQA